MKSKFSVGYESNIILYGAASIGKIMHEQFVNNGYNVIGFIDKRASEINEFRGLPVWAIDSVPIHIKENLQTIVYVSVKNVFEHEKIVKELVYHNLNNIIYKPYDVLMGSASEEDLEIDKAYENYAITGSWEQMKQIPTSKKRVKQYQKDYGIVREYSDEVIAYIPIDYIYTNNYTDEYMKKWGNINLLAFFTHIQFFQYFQGISKSDYNLYIEEYCVYTGMLQNDVKITEAWKDNVFRNRMQIYKEMDLSLQLDFEFFINNAPTAEWNYRGWFNLTSGKHRSTFLASKGYYLIPLRVSRVDYYKFLNLDIFREVQIKCESLNLDIENLNLPHPYLYRCNTSSVVTDYNIIRKLVMYLAQRLYKKYGRIDFSKIYINKYFGEEYLQIILYFVKMGCVGNFEYLEKEPYSSICQLQHLDIIKKYDYINHIEQVDFVDLDYYKSLSLDIESIQGNVAVFIYKGELNRDMECLLQKYKVADVLDVSNDRVPKKLYICLKNKGDRDVII